MATEAVMAGIEEEIDTEGTTNDLSKRGPADALTAEKRATWPETATSVHFSLISARKPREFNNDRGGFRGGYRGGDRDNDRGGYDRRGDRDRENDDRDKKKRKGSDSGSRSRSRSGDKKRKAQRKRRSSSSRSRS